MRKGIMVGIMPLSPKDLGAFLCPFDFGKSIRNCKTIVQLQVVMYAIVKSRLQIKLKPIKGSSKKSILIFSVVGTSECSVPFLQARKGLVCQLVRKDNDDSIVGNAVKRKINYREEEIPDCGCIYG